MSEPKCAQRRSTVAQPTLIASAQQAKEAPGQRSWSHALQWCHWQCAPACSWQLLAENLLRQTTGEPLAGEPITMRVCRPTAALLKTRRDVIPHAVNNCFQGLSFRRFQLKPSLSPVAFVPGKRRKLLTSEQSVTGSSGCPRACRAPAGYSSFCFGSKLEIEHVFESSPFSFVPRRRGTGYAYNLALYATLRHAFHQNYFDRYVLLENRWQDRNQLRCGIERWISHQGHAVHNSY